MSPLPLPLPPEDAPIDLEPDALADADARADLDAVRRVVAGERSAFAPLVARYGRRLHDLALRMLRDPGEAEDVAQQAFLNAYRAIARFDGRRPFRHWLLRIATNLCRNRLAERRRRPHWVGGVPGDDEGFVLDPAAPPPPAGAGADARSDAERVRDAIERLPEPYRLAVVLRYAQGLSLEEVSEITEVPVATVKTHLHRARAALRRLLEPGETRGGRAGTEGRE